MFIPEFKEKTVPVYEMESYLNDSSEEAKTFKRILTAVRELKIYLSVEEVALLLEYKEKTELEVYSILVTLGKVTRTDYDYYSLKADFEAIEEYKAFKDYPIDQMKYYAVKQLMEELFLIQSILVECSNLNYNSVPVTVENIYNLKENLEN